MAHLATVKGATETSMSQRESSAQSARCCPIRRYPVLARLSTNPFATAEDALAQVDMGRVA